MTEKDTLDTNTPDSESSSLVDPAELVHLLSTPIKGRMFGKNRQHVWLAKPKCERWRAPEPDRRDCRQDGLAGRIQLA